MPSTTADRRERILQAAVRVMKKSGAGGFSQLQVAKAVGIEQGHLTYFFPRRHDLLAAVARAYGDATVAEVLALADDQRRDGGRELVRRLARDRERTRMWLGLLVEADADASLRGSLAENTAVIRGGLARLLDRDREDPKVALALYALWGVALAHLLHRDPGADGVTDRLLDDVLSTFAASAPRKRVARTAKRRRS